MNLCTTLPQADLQALRKHAMLVQKAYAKVRAYLRRPAHERGFVNHKGPGYAPLLASARRTAKHSGGARKPLSDAQLAALHGYTGSDYVKMNQAERGLLDKNTAEGLRAQIEVMKAGLAKLPPYVGDVNRGTTLPSEILRQLQPGNTWIPKGFTSASTGAGFGGPHRLKIQSRTGRDISWLSQHPGEQEVLFPPGTKFLVKSRKAKAGGRIQITLEEVADGKNND